MITADYMEDETFAFGPETGLFQSLFDETKQDGNDNFKNSDDVSKFNGLFPELGFPDEEMAPQWSLLEQLDMTTSENPSLDDFLDEAYSPHSSVSNETSFNEEHCLLSPLSESGDSGISSCLSPYNEAGSPYSRGMLEEPSMTAEQSDQILKQFDLNEAAELESNVDILADLVREITQTSEVSDSVPSFTAPEPIFIQQNDILPGMVVEPIAENVETTQVPFIEENHLSPDIVQEFTPRNQMVANHKPIHIIPAPLEAAKPNMKISVVKSETSRRSPYQKKRPAKKSPEQKEKKKNQNRNAATRYRTKKKDELQLLFDEAEQLDETNKGLHDKVCSLTKEIDYLKGLMLDVIKAKLSRSNAQQ